MVRARLKRWIWFAALWTAGVITVATGAYAVKVLLGI
jgi:hypothetical protein